MSAVKPTFNSSNSSSWPLWLGTWKISSRITVFTIPKHLLAWATSLISFCLLSIPHYLEHIDITSCSSIFLVRIYRCQCKIFQLPYNLMKLSVQGENIIMKLSKKYSRHTPIVNLLTINRLHNLGQSYPNI